MTADHGRTQTGDAGAGGKSTGVARFADGTEIAYELSGSGPARPGRPAPGARGGRKLRLTLTLREAERWGP